MFIVTGCDLETTGLNADKGDQIIEIGLSLYGTEDGLSFKKLAKTMCKRCCPTTPIKADAERVHGISMVDLKDEGSWIEDVAPIVSRVLKRSHLFVAHNVNFDAPFLAYELIRAGLDVPDIDSFCTMEQGRAVTALGKAPNLGELCWAYGVSYDPDVAHAADYDIDCTMNCFIKGVQRGDFVIPSIEKYKEKLCL